MAVAAAPRIARPAVLILRAEALPGRTMTLTLVPDISITPSSDERIAAVEELARTVPTAGSRRHDAAVPSGRETATLVRFPNARDARPMTSGHADLDPRCRWHRRRASRHDLEGVIR